MRYVVLLAAVSQIVAPFFVNPFRDGNDAVRAGEPSQIEPAGYAFAIWGLIYLLALAYAVWQVTPDGRGDPITARLAPFAVTIYLGSTVWLAAAQYGPVWATMPILAAMAACAVAALSIATSTPDASPWRHWAAVVPFGLYAGWTVCATFVNVAEVAPQYGFDRFGLSVPAYAVASLAAATILAAIALWLTRGEFAFAATVLWALAAIIVAGRERGADWSVIAAAGAGMAAIILLTAAVRLWSAYR